MKRILICDDEHALADELAEYFSSNGWDAVQVYEASRAMDLLASMKAFTCLLTDFAMPHLSGASLIDFARTLPAEQQPKVICVMTGASLALRGALPEAVDAFRKPFNPVVMHNQILQLLESEREQ